MAALFEDEREAETAGLTALLQQVRTRMQRLETIREPLLREDLGAA